MTSSPEVVRIKKILIDFGVLGPTEFSSEVCFPLVSRASLRSATIDTLGPHADYHDLIICKNGQHKVLVHADQKKSLVGDEGIFPGIFLIGDNIFIHGSCLYLTTLWRNRHAIIEVKLENGETRPLCFDDSVSRKSSKSKNKFEV